MARTQARSGGLFSGLVLLSAGILLLLHNYGHLDLHEFFTRWWPLLIIFWGIVKLYERTVGQKFGGGGGGISTGEVLLVLGMLALMNGRGGGLRQGEVRGYDRGHSGRQLLVRPRRIAKRDSAECPRRCADGARRYNGTLIG